jgi:BNR repeat-like domain
MGVVKIVAQGVACSGRKGTARSSCAFPGIAVLPSGRWVCGFRAAPLKKEPAGQQALITLSDDEGKTWTVPGSPFVPPEVDGRPGLFRAAYPTSLGGNRLLAALCWVEHSDPSLPFFNEETEGLLDTRIFLARSEDGGATWSEPALVDTAPFHVPTPLTGPVIVLPEGELALQFELNKAYFDPTPWRHASVMLFSADSGRSWPRPSVVSRDPDNRIFYWDQRPGLLADGSLLDLFWTYDRAGSEYLNIHACRSHDNGRSWSDIRDTGVPGQPAAPVSLADGRVVMVYVDRTGTPIIKLRVSADGGKTWPRSTEMVLFQSGLGSQSGKKGSLQEAWTEMEKFSLGLPAAASLPGGDVLVVFYAGPEPDLTDIRWLRVRP